MNQLLDVGELVAENKRQESNRLDLFESILIGCHDLIKRHNKQRIREMYYNIPPWVYGKPKYDINILRRYLVHHLRDNGLKVEESEMDPYCLYVSWKETDIDLSKFVKRKSQINSRQENLYMIDNVSPPINAQQMKMLQFRQDKQKQLQQERKQRYEMQKNRMPPMPDMNFQSYVKKF